MRATTGFIRLLIRSLLWDSQRLKITFEDALRDAARARLTQTLSGKVLIGAARNGTSTTYTLPPIGTLSADDIALAISAILDAIDAIKPTLPVIPPATAPTDDALVSALLAYFATIRETVPDFGQRHPVEYAAP